MTRFALFLLCVGVMLFAACGGAPDLPTPAAPAAGVTGVAQAPETETTEQLEPTPTLLVTDAEEASPTVEAPTPEVDPSPTAEPSRWRVRVAPGVPPDLAAAMDEVVQEHADRFAPAEEGEEADVTLKLEGSEPLATWVYAVVVPFATVNDSTTFADLQTNWTTGAAPQAVVEGHTGALLLGLWGEGGAQEVDAEQLVDQLWQQRPAWSLTPFHRLEPSLKVLPVDGVSPLDADFEAGDYPFTFDFGLQGEHAAVSALREVWNGPQTNYDAGDITRVAMTGVTALVRATAYQMEIRGISYPGEEVRAVLNGADIAHVSNEVSFVPDCPPPHYIGDPVFCSSPRYMALLEELGVDVVELTGNHLNDWGAQYLPYTLDLYDDAGMRYFGGGRDLAQSQAPLVVEHNGNQVAFVGCNPVGPPGGWATAERPGSAPCDYDALYAQIAELQAAGHVVIATQQYNEIYHYAPTAQQQEDFRALAQAGAAAVSGSQGHHAQGFDFHEGAFIHYGLGNLFFDQMDMLGTRQTMVDVYTIYDNRLLSVQLWTGLIENYARPRLMSQEERRDLMQTLFEASGW